MTTFNVGYLVGSLSTDSINRKLARALTRLAPEGMTFHEIGFADLPLHNYDFDADYPAEATAFKAAIKGSDALLIVTRNTIVRYPARSRTLLTGAVVPGGPTPSPASRRR